MTITDTRTFGVLDCELKEVTVKAAGSGEFEAILSVPTVDRDGEIVDAGCFDPLPDYIPIDIDHGMSVLSTVGSGVPFYDGDVLRFRGTFAATERAQEVRSLVVDGHIRKMSVAYMNSLYQDDDTGRPHLVKAELLNAAIVAIPSNRQADITVAKAALVKLAESGEFMQAMHDLAADHGAKCQHISADPEAEAAGTASVKDAVPPADPPADTEADTAQVLAMARAIAAQAEAALL